MIYADANSYCNICNTEQMLAAGEECGSLRVWQRAASLPNMNAGDRRLEALWNTYFYINIKSDHL